MLEEKGKPTETYATVNWWREQHVMLHQGSSLHKLRGVVRREYSVIRTIVY